MEREGRWFRKNTIVKRAFDRRTGRALGEALVARNLVRVAYDPRATR